MEKGLAIVVSRALVCALSSSVGLHLQTTAHLLQSLEPAEALHRVRVRHRRGPRRHRRSLRADRPRPGPRGRGGRRAVLQVQRRRADALLELLPGRRRSRVPAAVSAASRTGKQSGGSRGSRCGFGPRGRLHVTQLVPRALQKHLLLRQRVVLLHDFAFKLPQFPLRTLQLACLRLQLLLHLRQLLRRRAPRRRVRRSRAHRRVRHRHLRRHSRRRSKRRRTAGSHVVDVAQQVGVVPRQRRTRRRPRRRLADGSGRGGGVVREVVLGCQLRHHLLLAPPERCKDLGDACKPLGVLCVDLCQACAVERLRGLRQRGCLPVRHAVLCVERAQQLLVSAPVLLHDLRRPLDVRRVAPPQEGRHPRVQAGRLVHLVRRRRRRRRRRL
eukprot:Rhum_TRINITY_DN14851_c21_g1::Rhum_TRINITY_DN14851_c21_g1_i1::g.123093::m.123093